MELGAVMILAVGLFATRTVTRAADNDVRKLVNRR
jgi:hypothetical protein